MNTMTTVAAQVPAKDRMQAEEFSHLSDNQIDDQLMGDLDAVAAAHLAGCDACDRRVAEAAGPMTTFRDVTMAWSERRSATMPIPVVQADALLWQRRAGWAMTACALVVGISIITNGRNTQMLPASEQSAQTVPVSTAAVRTMSVPVAVAQSTGVEEAADEGTQRGAAPYSGDNQMLKAIDNELDASIETPAAIGLETVSDHPRSQNVQTSVTD